MQFWKDGIENMYPLKLKPIYWDCIWGNHKLAEIRKDPSIHGTSWEISAHPHADNIILNGVYAGRTLMQMLDDYPAEMLGEKRRSQMLRLCYLDAAQSLSIQVHPYNEYARIHENDEGKTESWYMVDVDPGSRLIAGTTASSKEELRKAVSEDRIEETVNRIEMENQDFICIDAGQLHALGAGILALEIGTNSDTTYRFYDYHRKGPDGKERELHLDKSFDVVDTEKQCQKTHHPVIAGQEKMMFDREEFSIKLVDLDGEYSFIPNGKTFYCLSNVSNDCQLIYDGEAVPFAYTENLFVPADCGEIIFKGKARILISFIR